MSLEQTIAHQLREMAIAEVRKSGLTDEAFGDKLGLQKQFAADLLQAPRWELRYAIQIIERLGLRLAVTAT